MPTPAKKKPVAKRKPPKKPVQKKEEIEKHLKAINAALGIDETSPEAASIAQAAEQVETKETAADGTHASDLIGEAESSESTEPVEETTEETSEETPEKPEEPAASPEKHAEVPAAASAVGPTPGEGTIPMGTQPATSETPAATPVQTATPVMPAMTDQPQTPASPMGNDGMVPPAEGGFDAAESGEGSKKKKIMIILLIVLFIVALGAGGLYFYNMMTAKQKASQSAAKKQSQAQFEPDATATPTEAALGDLAGYSIQVLNGSGIPGEAGAVEDLLDDAGFTDVTTGNADEYSYTDTEITLKKGSPQALYDEVEKALGSDYVVVQTADELDEESEYDVQVIVGSDSPEEATPAEEEE